MQVDHCCAYPLHGITGGFLETVAEYISRAMSATDESKSQPRRRVQFAFSDEQEQFRSALRRFLKDKSSTTEVRRLMATADGYDPQVWRQLSEELALPGIHIPEQYGGAGFGMVELCIVAEELGRALLCAPYFSTAVLAANAILNAGTEAQKSSLLPDLASGVRLATLAVTELNGRWDPGAIELVATPVADGYKLDGIKNYIVDGHVADLLVVAGRLPGTVGEAGVALFTLKADSAGVERRLLESMDPTRKLARIDFRGAHAELLGNVEDGATALARTLDQAAIALANEMVGGAQALFDSAVDYTKLRVQFGRTIGSFQAIKHKLRRHAARRRARQVGRLLRGSGCGDRTIPNGRRSPASRKPRRRKPICRPRSQRIQIARRHRLHLGQRHASLVQARQKLGGLSRPAELPSRAVDAALGSLSDD